jgi:hypothetical protein
MGRVRKRNWQSEVPRKEQKDERGTKKIKT